MIVINVLLNNKKIIPSSLFHFINTLHTQQAVPDTFMRFQVLGQPADFTGVSLYRHNLKAFMMIQMDMLGVLDDILMVTLDVNNFYSKGSSDDDS